MIDRRIVLNPVRRSPHFLRWTLATLAVLALSAASSAQTRVPAAGGVTDEEIAPGFHLLRDGADDLLVYAGPDASVVVGIQSPALAGRARALLDGLHAGPVRFAVAAESEAAPGYLDGGWGRTGALTLAHEMLDLRMEQWEKATREAGRSPLPGTALPATSFTGVFQVYLRQEEPHFIHERPGYANSDLIVHFEKAGILYLGNTFTTDGYPTVDMTRGGSLAGMIDTMDFFLQNFAGNHAKLEPIVPGRGPVATFEDLSVYRDMLVAVRDRIRAQVDAGRTGEEVVAAHPTASLDARWGDGPVSPDAFVRMAYASVVRTKHLEEARAAQEHAGH
jgi:cyclase